MTNELINGGNLTAEGVSCILNFLSSHEPKGCACNKESHGFAEAGRSIILGWCRYSLIAQDDVKNLYASIGVDQVIYVLAFLNSQKYLEGCEYEAKPMETARSLIFQWCQNGLSKEEAPQARRHEETPVAAIERSDTDTVH